MLIRALLVAAVVTVFAVPAVAQEFSIPLSARMHQSLLAIPEAEPFSYPSPGHRLLVGPEEGQPWDVNLTIGGDWNTNVPIYGDRFTVRREIDGRRSASADTGLTGYHLWRSLPPQTLITGCGFSATSYMSQPQFDQRNYNCMARYDHVVTSDFVASAGLFDQVTELDGQL